MEFMIKECNYEQVIAQLEIIPVIAARLKWSHLLRASGSRRVFLYLDNDSARYGLIKGYSPTRFSAWLLTEAWRLDEQTGAVTWFERVPSKSNCSDGPSRLDFSKLCKLLDGETRIVSSPPMWDELFRRHEIVGGKAGRRKAPPLEVRTLG